MTTGPDRLSEFFAKQRRWLVTGAAGFIGSHLVEFLLKHDQEVIGLDNLSSGFHKNLEEVKKRVGATFAQFKFIEGDIVNKQTCEEACDGVEFILHQAAIGSVSKSIENPLSSHAVNVTGFLNLLLAARDAGVSRFIFASSSAVYGDVCELPQREESLGNLLSPYAATKRFDELYAFLAQSLWGLETIALRYFNVFGPRQDPSGDYAAVIPRWIAARMQGMACTINGDGETSRDFCFIENVVLANILAAAAPRSSCGSAYNIALGQQTTLNQLYSVIDQLTASPNSSRTPPHYGDFRLGDIRHSVANIESAKAALGFEPVVSVEEGLAQTVAWYLEN